MLHFQTPTPVTPIVDTAVLISQLPLHAILLIVMGIEGWIIKLLWDKMNSLHDKLDECLGIPKEPK